VTNKDKMLLFQWISFTIMWFSIVGIHTGILAFIEFCVVFELTSYIHFKIIGEQ
jgi:hypothetical protein